MSVLFAREGAQAFGCDINVDAASETARLVQEEGGQIEIARCDVTSADNLANTITSCITRFGRLDVLVNNVGIVDLGGPVE
jgi:NAD(P)-dependent dehydrogenase (short-subunit alcohol dehydrogenase family)